MRELIEERLVEKLDAPTKKVAMHLLKKLPKSVKILDMDMGSLIVKNGSQWFSLSVEDDILIAMIPNAKKRLAPTEKATINTPEEAEKWILKRMK